LLSDFELAKETLHDAFIAALQQWQRDGVPTKPREMRNHFRII
jgi:RNA polymerase sigma-70 factor (ECF subfamily)